MKYDSRCAFNKQEQLAKYSKNIALKRSNDIIGDRHTFLTSCHISSHLSFRVVSPWRQFFQRKMCSSTKAVWNFRAWNTGIWVFFERPKKRKKKSIASELTSREWPRQIKILDTESGAQRRRSVKEIELDLWNLWTEKINCFSAVVWSS